MAHYNLSVASIKYILSGKPIMAIKQHREERGLSLRDAKDDVDEYMEGLGIRTAPAKRPCGSCNGTGFVSEYGGRARVYIDLPEVGIRYVHPEA